MCEQDSFRDEVLASGLLVSLGVPGVFGRSGIFEGVVEAFQRCFEEAGAHHDAEVIRFPPVFARKHYVRFNHVHLFPHLMGSVHTFTGKERDHMALVGRLEGGEDWTDGLAPADAMLIPAACYPLYPTLAGTLPEGGRVVDLRSFVFRHEPSEDLARMQIFRQREYVRIGSAEQAQSHRDEWIERGLGLLRGLGLPVEAVVANDPFFGRGGRMAGASQREQELKYELVVPITSEEKPTAIASSNASKKSRP